MAWRIVIIATFIILILVPTAGANVRNENNSDLSRLVDWMTGSFNSEKQAQADSSYFAVRQEMRHIWPERSDAIWLYAEQATAESLDRPYRQRVYGVTQVDDSMFRSDVYAINDPLRFAGDWKNERPFARLTPDSLIFKEGCSVILKMEGDSVFTGGTVGTGCESSFRGAAYVSSEVKITATQLYSWDRGFDDNGNQVWGANKAGYLFEKIVDSSEGN